MQKSEEQKMDENVAALIYLNGAEFVGRLGVVGDDSVDQQSCNRFAWKN